MNPEEKAKQLQRILDRVADALHEIRERKSEEDRRRKRLDQLTMIILMNVTLAYELGQMHQLEDIIESNTTNGTPEVN